MDVRTLCRKTNRTISADEHQTGSTNNNCIKHSYCAHAVTVKPLILVTLNFGVRVNLIILDPVILAFLLPTTLKRYCIQIFAARCFRELARLAKYAK